MYSRTISTERLHCARLVGAASLALLGQLAVHFPQGYFGGSDTVTRFGILYAVVFGLATAVSIWGHLSHRRWAQPLTFVLYTVNLGVFTPAIISDPVIAGSLILWHLMLILRSYFSLFEVQRPTAIGTPDDLSPLGKWLTFTGPATLHLVLLSIFVTVGVVGYRLATGRLAQISCLSLNFLTAALAFRFLFLEIVAGRRTLALVLVPLVISGVLVGNPSAALAFVLLFQVCILALLISKEQVVSELMDFLLQQTAVLTVFTFLFLSIVGTLLLTFPASSSSGVGISPLDALFTSTSATCVTGLTVLDTPQDFSNFGQLVILSLIQVGGLGIMVLSTFATLLLGGHLGLRRGQSMAEMLDITGPKSAYRLTVFVVISTLAIESVGALLLLPSFLARGFSISESIWRSVFHSISAFCNAGFALQSDSLMMFQKDPYALSVVMVLITLGGIGFLVMAATWWRLRGEHIGALRLPVRVTVWMSAALTLTGFILILLVEWNNSLGSLPFIHRLTNALFQSVTLRTAGFNTVDLMAQHPATGLLMQLLMFIGASPGGTGGGIKTTTFLILLASVVSIMRGQSTVVISKRTIPYSIILRSVAIALLAAAVAFIGLFILLITQDQPASVLGFEVISALGTVGLSLGATTGLTPLGKLIVVTLMLVGRVGPLTATLILGRPRESKLLYAQTRIMVG